MLHQHAVYVVSRPTYQSGSLRRTIGSAGFAPKPEWANTQRPDFIGIAPTFGNGLTPSGL
jgi:hypothetical protein